ncbi:MAG: amidohydrolase family protein [Candidatus Hydrogenedens sp.]|nr:amidohydrolase family protein [Candidatus Hydrogenedens sp.]
MPTINRRFFLKSAAAASALATLGARAEGPSQGPFFDVHTHLGQMWGRRLQLTADNLLRWMDQHHIEQAVVLPLISPESWDYPISTGYVLKETAPHRDRLIPFCSIDPRTTLLQDREGILEVLGKYVAAGAKGFGEHKPGVAIDDPRNINLFKCCAELNLPVLFHLDNVRNTDAPGLPGLAQVLEAVPDGIFIGHAQGWWASISGDVTQEQLQGYPSGGVAAGGAIDALMERFPNLYGDLSAGSGNNALARDLDFAREFMIRRADRLLFGTDYLRPEQDVPQFDTLGKIDLPQEVREKIFTGNARRLLGLA